MRSELTKKTVRFGAFALDLDTGELRRHGIRVRLQDKSFQILQALLEHSGQVVTRDELRKRLWPDDTFVDFESGLNTAVNRLRLALGDSAENPTYVDTVARKGYRFIGVVAETAEAMEPVRVETAVTPVQFSPPTRRWTAIAVLAAALLLSFAVWITRRTPVQAVFHQITFNQGILGNARFAPDGQTVLYSANWDGKGPQLYLANTVSPESRELGFQSVLLAGVSPSTELALLFLEPTSMHRGGNLSRVPLNGGAPLTVATNVFGAEWTLDGKALAVFRKEPRESVIEYPIGKVLYRTAGDITHLRISPRGDSFAFLEHPVRGDDGGMVRWMDLAGHTRDLTGWWASAAGLAWSPSGREVWFTASPSGVRRSLYAATMSGGIRQIATMPGSLMLFDISRTGRVLLTLDRERMMIQASLNGGMPNGGMPNGQTPNNQAQNGHGNESDATWFDWSHAQAISPDGKWLLFDETGEGGGPNHGVYLRDAANNSVVRLGDGQAMALSPDQKWAVALNTSRPTSLSLLTDAPELPRSISGNGITYRRARFFPDGRRLLVSGNFPGKPLRLFVQPVSGAPPTPLNQDVYLDFAVISPDGQQIAGMNENQRTAIVPAAGGSPRELAIPFAASPVEWTADGKSLFVKEIGCCPPVKIHRYDFATSQVHPWKQFAPADPVGVTYVMDVLVARDGRSYAYSYLRSLSELFVVDGWR